MLRIGRVVGVVLMALVVAACGGRGPVAVPPDPPAAPAVPPLDQVPVPQRAALADGKVTLTEYQAAYAAFTDCVAAGGGRLIEDSRDPTSGVIRYRVGARLGTPTVPDLTSVEGRCFHETFDVTEYVFQTTGPAAAG